MRFVPTAVGHVISDDRGLPVTRHLRGCHVTRANPRGYLALAVGRPDDCVFLTDVDRLVRRRLQLGRGPWDPGARVLTVKAGRGCAFTMAGERMGRLEDCSQGRAVDAAVTLAGAYATGYVWRAASVTLGPPALIVGG